MTARFYGTVSSFESGSRSQASRSNRYTVRSVQQSTLKTESQDQHDSQHSPPFISGIHIRIQDYEVKLRARYAYYDTVIRCRNNCVAYIQYRERQQDGTKSRNNNEQKWPVILEEAFWEAIMVYPPMGRQQRPLPGDESKLLGRNELIAQYLEDRTGDVYRIIRDARHNTSKNKDDRPRKMISSHVQVLRNKFLFMWEDEFRKKHEYIPPTSRPVITWLGPSQKRGKKNGQSILNRAQHLPCPPPYRLELDSTAMELTLRERQQQVIHTFTSTSPVGSKKQDLDLSQEQDWLEKLPELVDPFLQASSRCEFVLVESFLALPDRLPSKGLGEMKLDIKNFFVAPDDSPAHRNSVRTRVEIFENGRSTESWKYMWCEPDPETEQYLLPLGSCWWAKKLPGLWDYNEDKIRRFRVDEEFYESNLHALMKGRRKHAERELSKFTIVQQVSKPTKEEESKLDSDTDYTESPFLVVYWKFGLAPEGSPGRTYWRKIILPPDESLFPQADATMDWTQDDPYQASQSDLTPTPTPTIFPGNWDVHHDPLADQSFPPGESAVTAMNPSLSLDATGGGEVVTAEAMSQAEVFEQTASGVNENEGDVAEPPHLDVHLDPTFATTGEHSQETFTMSSQAITEYDAPDILPSEQPTYPTITDSFIKNEDATSANTSFPFHPQPEQHFNPMYANISNLRSTQQFLNEPGPPENLPLRPAHEQGDYTGENDYQGASQQPSDPSESTDATHEPPSYPVTIPQTDTDSQQNDNLAYITPYAPHHQAVQQASTTYQAYINHTPTLQPYLSEFEHAQQTPYLPSQPYPTHFTEPSNLATRRGSLAPTISTAHTSCFSELTPGPDTGATESFDHTHLGPSSREMVEEGTVLPSQYTSILDEDCDEGFSVDPAVLSAFDDGPVDVDGEGWCSTLEGSGPVQEEGEGDGWVVLDS